MEDFTETDVDILVEAGRNLAKTKHKPVNIHSHLLPEKGAKIPKLRRRLLWMAYNEERTIICNDF